MQKPNSEDIISACSLMSKKNPFRFLLCKNLCIALQAAFEGMLSKRGEKIDNSCCAKGRNAKTHIPLPKEKSEVKEQMLCYNCFV
jgi:hypothetical protein